MWLKFQRFVRFSLLSSKLWGLKKGIIMDGRDIGTVVFPNAECKFFLTATPEVRAKRRHLEQMDQGIHESYEDVLDNIQTRDLIDSTRETAPLRKASDAIEIDVSEHDFRRSVSTFNGRYILKKQSTTSYSTRKKLRLLFVSQVITIIFARF